MGRKNSGQSQSHSGNCEAFSARKNSGHHARSTCHSCGANRAGENKENRKVLNLLRDRPLAGRARLARRVRDGEVPGLVVQYEQLVCEPFRTMEEVCAYLEINFDQETVLTPTKTGPVLER
jgi:hypothetical protein